MSTLCHRHDQRRVRFRLRCFLLGVIAHDAFPPSDLDGDKFWVCSDPRLVPKPSNISPPSQRTSPAAASTSRRNSLKDMPQAAIDTFVIQHGVALLGQISRKWTAHTANHPDLAASAESMKLASCFEAAVVSTFCDVGLRRNRTDPNVGSYEDWRKPAADPRRRE